ncbi:MAG: cation-translocating P-type ATPase [Maricaulaceae bacterium]
MTDRTEPGPAHERAPNTDAATDTLETRDGSASDTAGASGEAGLTAAEAADRLKTYGPNTLPEPKTPSVATVFLRQFLSPFIYILIIAAAVSFAIGQTPSGVFIVAVLLLNAAIGAVQEVSAQRAAAALRAMVHGSAMVVRDGRTQSVDIIEVVPGDIVLLASGDRVPADMTLRQADDLSVDESMLTGESLAVVKDASAASAVDAPLGDRLDQVFAGAMVVRGRGRGVVTATGLDTQIGRIAERVTDPRVSEPPLMIRIRRFTYQVAGAIFCAILLLAGLMALQGGYDGTAMVMMAVGLAVSTIPEGLPAALTVALAIGMRRMAQTNVIIRKLVAVEALGSCTFICSDKTGTLTVNELTIDKVVLPSGRVYQTSGAGVAPGDVDGEGLEHIHELVVTGVLANESHLDYAGMDWSHQGDIVDVAFLVLAKKYGVSLNDVRSERGAPLQIIPYESQNAFSGCVCGPSETDAALYVKGGPEKILAASTRMQLDSGDEAPIDPALITSQFEDLAGRGYRVIALAQRSADGPVDGLSDLTFLGLAAMIDPVRPEARDAIARCKAGGIGVAMVTGDHPATARAIGADLGLCAPDAAVVSGADIRATEARGEDALKALILPARVFARIEPAQKELIVATFMQAGHFVAVTGDGVNDAPAMARANAGVAMGLSGSDVAKETADLIITDDNFASIVAGVEQGRIVYNNIRKVIGLLTATGFSAIVLFFLSVGFGLPMPLTAVQLLWLNLVANGLQDVALAFEPKEGGELDRPPRNPNEPIFERHIIEHVLVMGSVMGVLAFGVFNTAMGHGVEHAMAQNLTLLTMVLFGNMHALSSRSETRSVFTIPYAANRFLAIATPAALGIHLLSMHIPGLRDVLGLAPVPFETFAMLFGVALTFLIAEELHKASLRFRTNHPRERTSS